MKSNLKYHQGSVQAVIAFGNKRIFHNTRVKVPKTALDSKGFVKSSAVENASVLNKIILQKQKELDDAILQTMVMGDLDLDIVKDVLNNKHVRQDSSDDLSKVNLETIIKRFIATQINIDRHLKWRYELMEKCAKDFNKSCKNLTPQDVYDFLQKVYGDVSENTAGTRCKNFKRIYRWAERNKYPLPFIEDWKKMKPKGFKAEFVTLNEERLKELREWQATTEHYDKVRNIFLVLCYTGMRYSDYLNFKPSDIVNGDIVKVDKKTTTKFKIPVSKHIAHIIQNPPTMANQNFNSSIKEIGEILGWTEEVRMRKRLEEFDSKPFFKRLKSHIGRHTAATRWLTNGVPTATIISWTGWSQEDMAYYYGDLLKHDTKNEMERLDNI